jgi:hypothetical protein
MSDGHYCVIRDLGPVKGGKGLKHHEVVVDFTWRAFVRFVLVRRRRKALQTLQTETRSVWAPFEEREDARQSGRSAGRLESIDCYRWF